MRPRRFLAANVVMLACFAGTAAGAAPAAAAEPVLAPSCSAVVDGEPGQEVVLAPESVAEPLSGALAGLDPLGLLAVPFRAAWQGMAPIPVGTVPDGQAEIPGSQIADSVGRRLSEIPLLAPILEPLTKTASDALVGLCGILVRGAQPSTPPAASPGSPQPGTPGPPGSPSSGGYSGGRLLTPVETSGGSGAVFGPRLSGLPSGAFFGLNTSGVPQSGVLAGPQEAQGPQPAAMANSDSAGSAQELPATQPDELSLPALLAALLLAIVGAQLVRRWVLHTKP